MNSLRDVYKRFKENHLTEVGGVNLYPQYSSDLEQLMEYLDNDWGLIDVEVDCMWRPPYGEED